MLKRRLLRDGDISNGRKIAIFFILSVFILLMSGSATFIVDDIFYTFIWIVIFLMYLHYNTIKLDKFMVVVLVLWTVINIIGYYTNNGLNFKFITFVGTTMKIILPYFMVKIVGRKFFFYLNKYIYYLTVISLVFYFIDLLAPAVFESVKSLLTFMTQEDQKNAGGWYIYVYMHNAWAYVYGLPWLFRNSGFMWEAGGNAMILTFALIYTLLENGFKINKYVIVYIVAIIFTFSTSGYLALMVILYAYLIKTNKLRMMKFVLIPIFLYLAVNIFELDFVKGKIVQYEKDIDRYALHKTAKVFRINRFGIMKFNLEQSIYSPLGNGVSDSQYLKKKYGVIFDGSNTIARVLYIWGYPGLFLMLFIIYRFYFVMFRENRVVSVLFTVAFSFMLFSNPVEYRPMIFTMIFFYFMYYHKKRVKNISFSSHRNQASSMVPS